jgi:hypothetical protein
LIFLIIEKKREKERKREKKEEKERKREKKGEKNAKLAIINNNCYTV